MHGTHGTGKLETLRNTDRFRTSGTYGTFGTHGTGKLETLEKNLDSCLFQDIWEVWDAWDGLNKDT